MKLLKILVVSVISLFTLPVSSFESSKDDLQKPLIDCTNFNEQMCSKNFEYCNWGGPLSGCMNRYYPNQVEIDCYNLNRQQCLQFPKECIYIGCSYGCPGCIFRNETDFKQLGSIQTNIQHSTSDYWGHDTSSGPDGGVEACAWAVNNIISNAGYRKVGDNPDYVPSVVASLKAGRGRQIQASQAVAGDLVVACGEQHIGICMEDHCNTIDSNSSSRRCFCWRSGFNFDNYFNCGSASYWRVDN